MTIDKEKIMKFESKYDIKCILLQSSIEKVI